MSDVHKPSRDFVDDRGFLLNFPEEPIYDNEDEAEEWARRTSAVGFFNYESAKRKAKKPLKADDEDNKDDDSFATFTLNSPAFKEGNIKAHEGDAIADATLKTDSGVVRRHSGGTPTS